MTGIDKDADKKLILRWFWNLGINPAHLKICKNTVTH